MRARQIDWRIDVKFLKNSAQIIAFSAVCITVTTAVQAREYREDPAVGNAVMTQEIIDGIYRSGSMLAAQAPQLAEICPLLALGS